MNICTECEHYISDGIDSTRCRNTKKIDVTGLISYETCNVERSRIHILPSRHCGNVGRYWQPVNNNNKTNDCN